MMHFRFGPPSSSSASAPRASNYCAEPAGTCTHAGATHTFKMCDDASGVVKEGGGVRTLQRTGFAACDSSASNPAWAWPTGVCSSVATMTLSPKIPLLPSAGARRTARRRPTAPAFDVLSRGGSVRPDRLDCFGTATTATTRAELQLNLIQYSSNPTTRQQTTHSKLARDCDSDSHCGTGLYCMRRDADEPIPDCPGQAISGYDYCVQTAPLSTALAGPLARRPTHRPRRPRPRRRPCPPPRHRRRLRLHRRATRTRPRRV